MDLVRALAEIVTSGEDSDAPASLKFKELVEQAGVFLAPDFEGR